MRKSVLCVLFVVAIFCFMFGGCAFKIPTAHINSTVRAQIVNGEPTVEYEREFNGYATKEPPTVAPELGEFYYYATLAKQAENGGSSPPIKRVLAGLWNDSREYFIQILDGPFKGMALEPGEKSRRIPVEPGEIAFRIYWKNIFTGKHGKKIKNKMVHEGTKFIPLAGDYN